MTYVRDGTAPPLRLFLFGLELLLWHLNVGRKVVGDDLGAQEAAVAVAALVVDANAGQWYWRIRDHVLNVNEGHSALGGILVQSRVGEVDALIVA